MTTTETPEMAEQLIERALTLSSADRERIVLALLPSIDPPPGPPDSDWAYWKMEIARRIEAVRNGTAKTVTPEQMHAAVRTALEEGRKT